MNKKEIIIIDRITNQITSEVNFGTQLEVLAANEHGEERNVGIYPLCRFVSSKKGRIQFEIYVENKIIRFPIEELENSILVAKKSVQSEDSFGYSNDK